MKRYQVEIWVTTQLLYTVEADFEDAAVDRAWDELLMDEEPTASERHADVHSVTEIKEEATNADD